MTYMVYLKFHSLKKYFFVHKVVGFCDPVWVPRRPIGRVLVLSRLGTSYVLVFVSES